MKLNKIAVATAFVAALGFPAISFSQSMNAKQGGTSANASEKFEVWQPLKINEAGNILNNVGFYRLKAQCNGNDVILLRIANSNKFPVKVEWKTVPGGPKTEVIIPPTTELQGTCPGGMNISASNLCLNMPQDPDQRTKAKDYFVSTLVITKVSENPTK